MGKLAVKAEIVGLEEILDGLAGKFPKTVGRKMFGCHALWANGTVFAMVWKEGRIGVRLPEEASFEKLMGTRGSAPWKAGETTMSHWVLVNPQWHDQPKDLSPWLRKAHELALRAAPKSKPVVKKKAASFPRQPLKTRGKPAPKSSGRR